MESSTQKSLVFSVTAIGAVLGLIPSVPLIDFFGIRKVLTITGMISALGTILFPISVEIHYFLVIACRILQGIGISILFTVVGVVPGIWAPTSETGTFLAILSCAFQLSMIICMPISGVLCDSKFGWKSIFYLFGWSTFLFYIVFWIFYKDTPRDHENVSEMELEWIENGKVAKLEKSKVPYWDICTDPTVITSWLSVFGGNFGFTILTLYGPTYLKDVLQFDVKKTGFATALPFVLSAMVKFAAGRISDKLDRFSEKTRFTFCAVVSQGSVVAGMMVMALRCRQHVHFAITVISFFAYFIYFGAPIVVGLLTSENNGTTAGNWSQLFIIVSIITIITNAPFPFFTSQEPGPFLRLDGKIGK